MKEAVNNVPAGTESVNTDARPMRVVIHPYKKGACYGNILWRGKFEMRAGKFPSNHPIGGGAIPKKDPFEFSSEFGGGGTIEAFRARGYWASCFPEGDGITFSHEEPKSDEQVAKDVAEVFGWEVGKRL